MGIYFFKGKLKATNDIQITEQFLDISNIVINT